MDVSTPPSLDLACPQAKTEIEKHVHMLRERERGVDKNKIRTSKHHVNYYNSHKFKHRTFMIELAAYTSHE